MHGLDLIGSPCLSGSLSAMRLYSAKDGKNENTDQDREQKSLRFLQLTLGESHKSADRLFFSHRCSAAFFSQIISQLQEMQVQIC